MRSNDPSHRESAAVRLLRELERHLGDARGLQQWQPGSGLELSQYAILELIDREGPMTTTAAALALYLDTSTVSRQVQAAARQGLLERTGSASDRRSTVLSITPQGRRLLRQATAVRNQALEETLDGWSESQRDELLAQVQRLNDACRDRWRPIS